MDNKLKGVLPAFTRGCRGHPIDEQAMPSNKSAVAKHREKINADPIARAQLLARRRESYQRRKRAAKGANPDHPPIRSLSDAEVSEKRKHWRETQKRHRAAAKCLRAVLDITPESFEEHPDEMLARPHPAALIPQPQSPPAVPIPPTRSPPALIPQPQSPSEPIPPTQSAPELIPLPGCSRASEPLASSTPRQEKNTQRSFDRFKTQNIALKRELSQLKKQLAQAKGRNENLRKGLQREKKKLQPKEKNVRKVSLKKKVTRRKKVLEFLFCDRNKMTCECGPSVGITFGESAEIFENAEEDLTGKFVIVRYDSKPFVGQVEQVVAGELEVNCMHQSAPGKNAFIWPEPQDKLFYFKEDIKAVVSEPEPLTMRQSKLSQGDWEKFLWPIKTLIHRQTQNIDMNLKVQS